MERDASSASVVEMNRGRGRSDMSAEVENEDVENAQDSAQTTHSLAARSAQNR